jgi:hypothetical protein
MSRPGVVLEVEVVVNEAGFGGALSRFVLAAQGDNDED